MEIKSLSSEKDASKPYFSSSFCCSLLCKMASKDGDFTSQKKPGSRIPQKSGCNTSLKAFKSTLQKHTRCCTVIYRLLHVVLVMMMCWLSLLLAKLHWLVPNLLVEALESCSFMIWIWLSQQPKHPTAQWHVSFGANYVSHLNSTIRKPSACHELLIWTSHCDIVCQPVHIITNRPNVQGSPFAWKIHPPLHPPRHTRRVDLPQLPLHCGACKEF